MADWDEAEHPRDQRGRFRDKTGWAGAVADRLSSLWSSRVRASDELIDVSDLGPQAISLLADPWQHGDPMLAGIYHKQGFDGPPARVVSEAEMDRLIADGEVIEVWRGVETVHRGPDGSTTGEEFAELYRTGPYFAGKGARGNGTYTTTNRVKAEIAYADSGHSGSGAGLLRIGLAADARVVDWAEFETEVEQYQPAADRFKHAWYFGGPQDESMLGRIAADAGPETIQAWVLLDEGRLAAARGVDAIRVRRSGEDYYIILNRTATVVQEAG